ncbi:MAG: hypothetical protein JKY94_08125 [Rhodobacteraceae bacterium]|nr:hypothetical protein [Paracoccaceae bacterium]
MRGEMTDDEILARVKAIKKKRLKDQMRASFHESRDLKLCWDMRQGAITYGLSVCVDPMKLRVFFETVEDEEIKGMESFSYRPDPRGRSRC